MDIETEKALRAIKLYGRGFSDEEIESLELTKEHFQVSQALEWFVTDDEQARLEFAAWLVDHRRISEGEA